MNQTYNQSKKSTVACLACGDTIHVGSKPKIGNIIVCSGCDAELVIVKIDPLKVDWPEFDDDLGDLEEDDYTYEDIDDYDYDDYDDEDDSYDDDDDD